MDISDITWAAGFFQGEGWIGIVVQPRKTMEDYKYVDFKITQYYDPSPLQKYVDVFGVGSVGGPYEKGRGDTGCYQYFVNGNPAEFVLREIRPYLLGKKVSQVDSVLSEITEYKNKPRERDIILKSHCRNGHAFDDANTYFRKDGTRICRPCHNASKRKLRKKN